MPNPKLKTCQRCGELVDWRGATGLCLPCLQTPLPFPTSPPAGEGKPAALRLVPALHRTPTDTEVAAAATVAPRLGKLQRQVLDLLRDHPDGLTPEEVCEVWGWPPFKRTTVGPRCTELRDAGLIVDSGVRRQGPNQGSPSIVWRAL